MNTPDWHRIGGAADGDLILAVDVDGTARTEATFQDLVPLLAGIGDVRQTTLPDDLPGADLDYLLDGWSHATLAWAPRIRAILGYCSGALFALALADRLEDGYGARPQVILFDPERPTAATILEDFTTTLHAMSALEADERETYALRGRHLPESDLEQLVESLADIYGEACATNLDRLGIAADLAAELETAFRTYGHYLAGAAQIHDDGHRWTDATALLSATEPETQATALGIRHLRIDTPRDALLRSEATAAQVHDLLRSVAA